MSTSQHEVVGAVLVADGVATVRMESRYSTDPADLWAALTEPDRLARWMGQFAGDLRQGGTFAARFTSSWEGTGRVVVCERPHRLLVAVDDGEGTVTEIEAILTPDGADTLLVIEERGFEPGEAPAHGAGWQAHVEDLAAHLEGREPCDWRARWIELSPAYEERAADGR